MTPAPFRLPGATASAVNAARRKNEKGQRASAGLDCVVSCRQEFPDRLAEF